VGMHPDDTVSPIPVSCIQSHHVVFDIVYTPHETQLLHYATIKKAQKVYGYKMVLYGGIKIFELCTGKKAPVEVMEKALLEN
jgi:shikimate dehydrogenase